MAGFRTIILCLFFVVLLFQHVHGEPSPVPDIAGSWIGELDQAGYTYMYNLTIEQSGSNIWGTSSIQKIREPAGIMELTGTVKNGIFQFQEKRTIANPTNHFWALKSVSLRFEGNAPVAMSGTWGEGISSGGGTISLTKAPSLLIETPKTTPVASLTTDQKPSVAGSQGDFSQVLIVILGIIIACIILGAILIYSRGFFDRSKMAKHSGGTVSEPVKSERSPETPVQFKNKRDTAGKHDIIISYSTHDKGVADAICNSLESQKIRCWYAPRDILPGMNFQESIIDAIDSSSIMVIVFSSYSNDSPHVISEVTEAMAKGVIIIPFRIEDVLPSKAMKYLISASHWLDAMTPPLEEHIEKLVQTITVLLENRRKIKNPD
jgi:hypothetical protein